MKVYEVIVKGRVRETYRVHAQTADEAQQIWMDQDPVQSEVDDAEVSDVTEVGD